MKAVAALFDFDGTLTKIDSLLMFLWHQVKLWTFVRRSLSLASILLRYILGLIDNDTAKERLFVILFAQTSKSEFAAIAYSFSNSVLPTILSVEPMERLKWHREQGHRCILVSASIEDYLVPWAEAEGFSKVLATRLEVDAQGFLTGRFLGKNCYGTEKVRRIEEYLGALDQFEIYAYGDSRGDKEMLAIADHPFYRSVRQPTDFPSK